jgi:predicted MFS family arabinose efflux permease
VAAATSWRGAYVVVLAAYGVAVALIARGLARAPRPASGFTPGAVLAAYRPLLRDARMVALYAASTLRALGWLGPFLYLGAFLADRHGLSLRQIGFAYMVISGGMFAGNVAAGRWLAGQDLRRAFAAMTALIAVAWVAVFALALPAPLAVAAATAGAFAVGVSWIALTTILAAETPAGPGTTMVLNSAVLALGSALGSGVGGLLIGLGGYALLGLALPGTTVAAALLVWRPHFRPAIAIGRG